MSIPANIDEWRLDQLLEHYVRSRARRDAAEYSDVHATYQRKRQSGIDGMMAVEKELTRRIDGTSTGKAGA